MHAGQPILAERGRWADPRVARNTGVTQGVHVRPILVDPRADLISSADGPVAGDEDIDVVRRVLQQPERGEVVLDRVRGVAQVEHRNQDIRKHVAGDQHPAIADDRWAAGTIPALYVTAMTVAKNGAWPVGLRGRYPADAAHLQRYVEMAQTEAGFRRYLEQLLLESPAQI